MRATQLSDFSSAACPGRSVPLRPEQHTVKRVATAMETALNVVKLNSFCNETLAIQIFLKPQVLNMIDMSV